MSFFLPLLLVVEGHAGDFSLSSARSEHLGNASGGAEDDVGSHLLSCAVLTPILPPWL